jgi:FKBP-type peptidyl-prolyl cis-trans isomerase FklB
MKRLLMLCAIIMASASLMPSFAKDKKKKKQETPVEAPIKLVTPSDSMSYAAGMAASQGLLPYLQRQLHVDTAYMADFYRGYNEMVGKINDPAFVAYVAGTNIGQQALVQILPNMNRELAGTPDSLASAMFTQGFLAGVKNDTTHFKMEAAGKFFQERNKEISDAKQEAYKKENEEWLKNNATKPGVTVLPSGLQYKVITEGTGEKPQKPQTVQVVYEGKTIDGKVFDATSRHSGNKGYDAFRCDQVIKGWTEALTMMPVGSKWEIYIPQELAYGSRQAGQIKPYSTLIFTVELKGIEPEKATEAVKVTPTDKKATTKTAPTKKVNPKRGGRK